MDGLDGVGGVDGVGETGGAGGAVAGGDAGDAARSLAASGTTSFLAQPHFLNLFRMLVRPFLARRDMAVRLNFNSSPIW